VVRILPVDPDRPDPETVAEAGAVLRSGGLVVFPTETVYGIALDADNPDSVRRLYRLKGRREDKPLARILADPDEVRSLVPPPWEGILEFWPGPLTLVLPGAAVPEGYRCPGQELARELVRSAGVRVVATSANPSGEIPVSTGAEAAVIFGESVDLILDGGPCGGGMPSTVLDLSGKVPVIRRPGPLSVTELAARLRTTPEVAGKRSEDG
jgi:L-threonylcarbamoyladenylate synthase